MNKLELQIEREAIQGEFSLQRLNVLLIFQVNCPGCFTYALPILSKLFNNPKYKEISFFAVSTAFEDFGMNNQENTSLLINEGQLVGETKKALAQHKFDNLPYPIDFPIFMDKKIDSMEERDRLIETICSSNPNFRIWPEFEQENLKKRVHSYLQTLNSIYYTFNANNFKGTPTIVLFDNHYNILEKWFGHKSLIEVENLLQNHL